MKKEKPPEKDTPKEKAPEDPVGKVAPVVERKIPKEITRTALSCVICGIPLRDPRNPRRIVFTCSEICRRMSRGGKRNRRILDRMYVKRRDLWSKKQEELQYPRVTVKKTRP